jgi:hypothetical protein
MNSAQITSVNWIILLLLSLALCRSTAILLSGEHCSFTLDNGIKDLACSNPKFFFFENDLEWTFFVLSAQLFLLSSPRYQTTLILTSDKTVKMFFSNVFYRNMFFICYYLPVLQSFGIWNIRNNQNEMSY